MKSDSKKVIVVLGMHRGGTSAVARSLQVLGVGLGDNLYPPADDNPTGFWEDRDCIAINEELLSYVDSEYDRLGLAWDFDVADSSISHLYSRAIQLVSKNVVANQGSWGLKDPRICRLLGFWKEVFKASGCSVSYVIPVRDPVSVAESLEKRNRIPPEKSHLLWLQHMVPAILDSRNGDRVVISYDSLLDSPQEQLARIAGCLKIPFDENNNALLKDFSEKFLDSKLRHSVHTIDQISLDNRLPADALKAYRLLLRVAGDEVSLDSDEVHNTFAQIQANLKAYAPAFAYANLLELEVERLSPYQPVNDVDHQSASLTQNRNIGKVQLMITLAERDGQIADLTHTARELMVQVQQNQQARQALIVQSAENEQAAQAFVAQIQSLSSQITEQERVVQVLNSQMDEMINSKAWKIALFFRRVRIQLVPPNSLRARGLKLLTNVVLFPFRKIRIKRKFDQDRTLISSSGLFDEDWYLENNPDVAAAKVDPIFHYWRHGGYEGRDPNPHFSSAWYLSEYKDVTKAGMNPLVHYLRYGRVEKRKLQAEKIADALLLEQLNFKKQKLAADLSPKQDDDMLVISEPVKYIPMSDKDILMQGGNKRDGEISDNSNLKIVLVVHQFVPDYSSGTEVLTYETAKALQKQGHDVIVFTGYPAKGELRDHERFDRYAHDGIRVERFRHSYTPMGKQSNVMEMEYDNKLFAAYFREFLEYEKPDLVHFFHLSRLSASPIDVCRELNIPTVLTPTDFWFICHTSHLRWPGDRPCPGPDKYGVNCLRHVVAIHQFSKIDALFQKLPDWVIAALIFLVKHGFSFDKKYSPYVRALANRRDFLREKINHTDKVVVPTQVMLSSLIQNGLEVQRTISLPYGLNLSYLQDAKRPASGEFLRLGYIGTLYEHKGVHILAEAIKKLAGRPVELNIYGNLNDFPVYVAKLREINSDDPRVKFCGTFPNAEIGRIFSELDALVVPSLWHENAPLVIYTAQEARCPVIASNMAGMSEVIEHGRNGLLFEAGNVDDLVKTIELLLNDRRLLQKLSGNASKPLSIHEYALKLLDIYQGLIEKERSL